MPNEINTKARRGARCFLPVVPVQSLHHPSWKSHFLNVEREVIGYLELLAALHPTKRFAFASVNNVLTHCNKYRKSQPYSKAAVEKALHHIRDLGIIARIENMEWRGTVYRGFLVLPHESGCRAVDGKCKFLGGWDDWKPGKKRFFFNAAGELDIRPGPWPE